MYVSEILPGLFLSLAWWLVLTAFLKRAQARSSG
jgi:hypothetical protein